MASGKERVITKAQIAFCCAFGFWRFVFFFFFFFLQAAHIQLLKQKIIFFG